MVRFVAERLKGGCYSVIYIDDKGVGVAALTLTGRINTEPPYTFSKEELQALHEAIYEICDSAACPCVEYGRELSQGGD